MNVALKAVEESDNRHYILGIIDIHNFKKINDRFEHSVGNRILKKFAMTLKENEDSYITFRFGGDEFCLLFENVSIQVASETCKKIQIILNQVSLEEDNEVRLLLVLDSLNTQQLLVLLNYLFGRITHYIMPKKLEIKLRHLKKLPKK